MEAFWLGNSLTNIYQYGSPVIDEWELAVLTHLRHRHPLLVTTVDVEAAVKDASDPAWSLRADLTCDHVHPNQAGYQAIAAAIPLAVFTR